MCFLIHLHQETSESIHYHQFHNQYTLFELEIHILVRYLFNYSHMMKLNRTFERFTMKSEAIPGLRNI